MSITQTQKQTAQAIVRLFETGTVRGDYSKVTVLPGDTGHLSYGVLQSTLGGGGLYDLLNQYCSRPGALFSKQLTPFLTDLQQRNITLDNDAQLKNLLRAGADDLVMRDAQDAYFDNCYWQPACKMADKLGITTPLGTAVIFDSFVHGSFGAIQKVTAVKVGAPATAGEQVWIAAYVQQRRDWLANNKRADLRPCVYRMDSLQRLIDQAYWNLPLPLVVRDHEISELSLAQLPPNCYSGPTLGSRVLAVQTPLLRGADVRAVQLALATHNVDIIADGIFGQTSMRCVAQFQSQANMHATGVVDAALLTKLNLL